MEQERGQEIAERDQLWPGLRALRPESDRLAAGYFEGTDRQRVMVQVLARVVAAEMDFRARDAAG